MNLKLAALVLWTAFAACQSSTALPTTTPSRTAVACGEPAPVVAAPAGTGLGDGIALAGLFLTANWRSGSDFHNGYPTKVVVHATSTVSLYGSRCSDGQALRFWYREGNPPLGGLPASWLKLETTGDLAVQFHADSSPDESRGGYFLFPSAGDYLLTAGPPGTPGVPMLQVVVRVG
ncbi:MAG TPA: hypothetical protein VNU19_16885 [Candidatus Acidoferrum sp.]|nr:hypothetical protein [Candidatus Acidoferrum sp.]